MKVVLIAILLASTVYSETGDDKIKCKSGIVYTSDNGESNIPFKDIPLVPCNDPMAKPDHCYTFSGSFELNGAKCELFVQT